MRGSSGGWARYAIERWRLLLRWRELADIVARACRDVLGGRCVSVYVVGGAAEDRLTVLSDIDVVIVVDDAGLKTLDTILRIRRRAEELGLPEDAPIDVKVLTGEELERLKRRKIYRRTVRIL